MDSIDQAPSMGVRNQDAVIVQSLSGCSLSTFHVWRWWRLPDFHDETGFSISFFQCEEWTCGFHGITV